MSRERFNIGSLEGATRSGKGSLAEHFAKRPGVAKDETGADYRAVTKALLEKGTLDPEMNKDTVNKALARTATADIVDLAKNSHAIQAEHGLKALYAPDVANTVHHVAQHQELRTAVKAGFHWNDPEARTATAYAISEEWGVPTSLALQRLVTKPKSDLRVSVGALARRLGRQIYFNTDFREDYPENPVKPMLDAADILLNESLSTKPDFAKTTL